MKRWICARQKIKKNLFLRKNILSKNYMNEPKKRNKKLDEIVIYSSLYSGYGKATEIIYKIKEKNGDYA